jgi:hypothetical protein
MEYLDNLLKFVIQRCQVNMKDAHELINKCEHDYDTCDEHLPIIIYGNLLKINDDYKPVSRRIVKEVYMSNAQSVLGDIYSFAYTVRSSNDQ